MKSRFPRLLLRPVFTHISNFFSEKLKHWFFKRITRQQNYASLNRKTIYVLPTRYGFIFGFILFVMLMGAINYSNSMGFLLTFLLAGIALTAMLYSYRNLSGLVITARKANSVYAGDIAVFSLMMSDTNDQAAFAIQYGTNRKKPFITDINTSSQATISIPIQTTKRGLCELVPIRLWTEFPLGLFHIWSWVHLDMTLTVYPRPAGKPLTFLMSNCNNGNIQQNTSNHDDYAGMRKYQYGDSPKHIAWKAVAKGHDLLTKQFSGYTTNEIWLDWHSLPSLDTEQRLSQLCLWVLEANRSHLSYGLKLPCQVLEPAMGDRHKHICLEALALYGLRQS